MEYLHQVNMVKQSLEVSKPTYRKKTLSGKEKEDADTTANEQIESRSYFIQNGTNDNQIFPIETRQNYHHSHHFFMAVNYQSSDVLLQGLSDNRILYHSVT